jgi:hypothetical protein
MRTKTSAKLGPVVEFQMLQKWCLVCDLASTLASRPSLLLNFTALILDTGLVLHRTALVEVVKSADALPGLGQGKALGFTSGV